MQDNPASVPKDGHTAFRAGRYAEARALFAATWAALSRSLGEDHPDALTALSDYGAACAALADFAAARDAHAAALAGRRRVLGNDHPEVGASLHNLGAVQSAQGDPSAAAACHREALTIWEASLGPTHPVIAKVLGALGVLAREQGDAAAALAYARRAYRIRAEAPKRDDRLIAAALDDLAMAHAAAGEDNAALQAFEAALARVPPAERRGRRLAARLVNLGITARALGDLPAAKSWFAQAVAADPDFAQARHHLAALLARLGEHREATRAREAALRRQSVFVQKAAQPKAAVLILSLADTGNVPIDHILPERAFTRIFWFIAHAAMPLGADLPPYGAVFNGIGDPDMAGPAEPNMRAFLAANPALRVLNHPDRVAGSRRDTLADTLAGIPDIVVPRTCRIAGTMAPAERRRAIEAAGIAPPFLLRPAGAHGGDGVVRVPDWAAFDPAKLRAAKTWYASQFHDARSADGFYRKYRMAFIDRRPFPYHLAISDNWLVHYFSADMEGHDWKLAEEAAFLADPPCAAMEAIAERLDLDICGIDFTRLPDGRLLVFEANATMLFHPERAEGRLGFKNAAVGRIIEAAAGVFEGSKPALFF